ncbi:Mrm1p PWA37_001587 [Arxiozyma heterogenica]|uniref:Mrm1p n=1 Tax=Arxiozyma heterogenica TaxID=278026 RepID=UPI002EF418F5
MIILNKIRSLDLFRLPTLRRVSSIAINTVKKTSFDKKFDGIVNKKTKPWERDGFPDRETWFKKKYAHIHAKQKKKQAYLEQLAKLHELKKQERISHKQKYINNLSTTKQRNTISKSSLLEYIYGKNCVIAALMNKNRKNFYRLLYSNDSVLKNNPQLSRLIKEKNLKTVLTNKHELTLLTKNSVHNGLVLEVKPLDPLEITHLGPVNMEDATFQINTYQNEFDSPVLASSHKNIVHCKYMLKQNSNKLYPLGVYLDEVTDTHNLGAILRTSFYLGVDFIVISRRNCAQLSPVVNKCSSGAMEYIPIYMVDKPLTFFDKSQKKGQWTFITSCIEQNNKKTQISKLPLTDMHGLLEHGPVMLVVGNEGRGVRTNLQLKSDFAVQIPFGGPVESQSNIDSLNVSVATAILLSNLLPSSES